MVNYNLLLLLKLLDFLCHVLLSWHFVCASIIAKVLRDREMMELALEYPEYGFDKHKGYPTKVHMAALEEHGALEIHRKSFRPVQNALKRAALERS